MNLTIKSIRLKNFKGIKKRFVEFGDWTEILGGNGTGKTSIFDAFTWLLFDKDSTGSSNFGLKTKDKDMNVIHHIDHEVEAVLDISGVEITLRKVNAEKWSKKRGSNKAVLAGNPNEYFINDVPTKTGEYNKAIAQIIKEDIFMMITNPRYFSEQLHWKERRKILLEIWGGVLTDTDVIDSNAKLAELTKLLKGKAVDDYKKMITYQKKKLNKEKDGISPRIDEVHAGLPDVTDLDADYLRARKGEFNYKTEKLREGIATLKASGAKPQLKARIREIDSEIVELKAGSKAKGRGKLDLVSAIIVRLNEDLNKIRQELYTAENGVKLQLEDSQHHKKQMEGLRTEWFKINNGEFEFSQETVCPTCGQDLPETQLQGARDKAQGQYNINKASSLERITSGGQSHKKQKVEADKIVKEHREKADALQIRLSSLEKEVAEITAQRDKIKESIAVVDISTRPRYVTLIAEKDSLNEKLLADDGISEGVQKLQTLISNANESIRELDVKLAKIEVHAKSLDRIEELKAEEKKLAAQIEKLEQGEFLADLFTRTKVKLLDSKVNSLFKHTRFMLFETQVNGGISECCEATFDGVPWSKGLNNAGKVNTGIDIINTLSKFYGVTAPIFADEMESVEELYETEAQVICLTVDKFTEFRVEVR